MRSLEEARALDAADPLAPWRAHFALPRTAGGSPLNYLCGHSLGLMPLAARTLVDEELTRWADQAVAGHEHGPRPWIPYHENLAAPLAALTGAQADEVVAMNSLTVNLHLMLASFYRPTAQRRAILIEAGAFSSDRHAVASQIAWRGLDPRQELIELAPAPGADLIDEAQIEALLQREGERIALVLWPAVQFRTGQAFDVARIVRAAQAAGCAAGLDLAHSIGNLPMQLHDIGADFAVWCSYKYLNAGPGAIGGCFIHRRHSQAQSPLHHAGSLPGARLAGWWGHEESTRFLMEPQFRAARGAAAWQISNPPILSAAPLIASLQEFSGAGMGRLRAKSQALTAHLEELLQPLAAQVRSITPAQGAPSEAARRGCQLSLRLTAGSQRGRQVFEALLASGVVCDWRAPDIIRVAPVPLYNRFEDVWQFVQVLTRVLRSTP
ncbi:MAG: kynureninase [Proteobacteria bacterium]|nr:kynureninase [Pseudomonadota bacterium]